MAFYTPPLFLGGKKRPASPYIELFFFPYENARLENAHTHALIFRPNNSLTLA